MLNFHKKFKKKSQKISKKNLKKIPRYSKKKSRITKKFPYSLHRTWRQKTLSGLFFLGPKSRTIRGPFVPSIQGTKDYKTLVSLEGTHHQKKD